MQLEELSRLSTLTPIAAVVVEVKTEEELAIQVSETAKQRLSIHPLPLSRVRKNEESSPVESRPGEHFSFFFFSNSIPLPRTNLI